MTAKSAIIALFTALFFLGAGTALFLQHRSLVDLDWENQSLRQRIAEKSELATDNKRLSNLVARATSSQALPSGQLSDLPKLRGEVARLRLQSQEAGKLRNEIQRLRTEAVSQKTPAADAGSAAALPRYVPRESWAVAGYATPEAACQSVVWAISSGDVRTFHASLTEEGRQQLESEEKGQSESDLAAKGVRVLGKAKAFRVDAKEERSDGTVVLTVSLIRTDEPPQTEKITVKRVGPEWKLAPD